MVNNIAQCGRERQSEKGSVSVGDSHAAAQSRWERESNRWMDDLLHVQNVDSSNTVEPRSLFPTLYVGESDYGLYAMPAFVDEKTITIAPKYLGPPLLEGPMPIAVQTDDAPRNTPSSRPIVRINIDMPSITHRTIEGEFLLLGYHEPPETIRSQLLMQQSSKLMFSLPSITYVPSARQDETVSKKTVHQVWHLGSEQEWTLDFIISQMWKHHPAALGSLLVSICMLILMTVWMCGRQSGVASIAGEARSAQTSKRGARYWPLIGNDPPEGWMQVGSIFYDPQAILGRGCEGTIVYRGRFDGREVAVKRVVADFVRLADREVDLLRESDAHSHVIRYFCMESDSLFRYIALELCEGSLYEYVEREAVRDKCPLSEMEVLLQATDGVAYLHSINIVHRDIKPQNVLLSIPNRQGQVRALISDFGLCKRLQSGRNSVSRRSGLAGTDGWIAPEALLCDSSVTCAVDVFSLGCIYYYVLTKGKHPFGDNLRRQANIMQGEYSLKILNASSNAIAVTLIESMLQRDASRRPSASDLVTHPFFWSKERQLQFYSDVSDRVEKEDEQSVVVRRLERNARGVVTNNWRQVICSALAEGVLFPLFLFQVTLQVQLKTHRFSFAVTPSNCLTISQHPTPMYKLLCNRLILLPHPIANIRGRDLRKFRTYKGSSVRDLLRAMRNKKHHYRELPFEVRASLGHIPDQFVTYFNDRFPMLLLHTYEAMSVCANEHVFSGYYSVHAKRRAAVFGEQQSRQSSNVWTTSTNLLERLPRKLLLHTYEAMSVCANEHVFSGYYSVHAKRRAAVFGEQQSRQSSNVWTTSTNLLERLPRKVQNASQESPQMWQRARKPARQSLLRNPRDDQPTAGLAEEEEPRDQEIGKN
ncbi:Serine/threonine-protein kinase/endoribonuclease ire-1 [Toxocara canis]|uniref:non-specific serine/threonine protein kinase n=1 Tax=Toxocara canis TaxID=6265 RepID=A0A0B2V693_TOXCA|nr:Serine/threonine-protein kinase/endoribonuclease ire-1 [Toxocara canis]